MYLIDAGRRRIIYPSINRRVGAMLFLHGWVIIQEQKREQCSVLDD